jgi:insulysin
LLNKDGTEREVNAVNSEFEKNFPSDTRRLRQVLAENMWDQNHPRAGFGTGNLKSLSSNGYDILWEDLNSFFNE